MTITKKKVWVVTFSFPLTGMGFENADAVESKFGRAEGSGASMGSNGCRDLCRDLMYDATSAKAAKRLEQTVRAWCIKEGIKGVKSIIA